MELLNAEYRKSEQAIYFSCNKESEDQGAFSFIILRETMNSLKVSPSEFRLFEGEQERSCTMVEMSYL